MLTAWLVINEPFWSIDLKDSGPTAWNESFYTIHVGQFGWIDGPRTRDRFVVKVRRDIKNIGGIDVDLKAPLSFERIRDFLKEGIPNG